MLDNTKTRLLVVQSISSSEKTPPTNQTFNGIEENSAQRLNSIIMCNGTSNLKRVLVIMPFYYSIYLKGKRALGKSRSVGFSPVILSKQYIYWICKFDSSFKFM